MRVGRRWTLSIGYHTLPLARIVSTGKVHAVDVWEEGLTYLKGRTEPAQNIEVIYCRAEAIELPPLSLDDGRTTSSPSRRRCSQQSG